MTGTQEKKRKLAVHVGETLRAARQKAELTQVDVAERVDLVPEVYGRMERGNMLPSVSSLRRLCLALRLDANVVLGLDTGNGTVQAQAWQEEPTPEPEEPLELRRVVRMLRQMDAAQLAVVSSTASALLKYLGPLPEDTSE
jgi:transcriptional regulator with XRE-family HTH domain